LVTVVLAGKLKLKRFPSDLNRRDSLGVRNG